MTFNTFNTIAVHVVRGEWSTSNCGVKISCKIYPANFTAVLEISGVGLNLTRKSCDVTEILRKMNSTVCCSQQATHWHRRRHLTPSSLRLWYRTDTKLHHNRA